MSPFSNILIIFLLGIFLNSSVVAFTTKECGSKSTLRRIVMNPDPPVAGEQVVFLVAFQAESHVPLLTLTCEQIQPPSNKPPRTFELETKDKGLKAQYAAHFDMIIPAGLKGMMVDYKIRVTNGDGQDEICVVLSTKVL